MYSNPFDYDEEYPGQKSGCGGVGPCSCPTGHQEPEKPRYRPRKQRYYGGFVDDGNGNSGFPDDFGDWEDEDWRWDNDNKEVRPYRRVSQKPVTFSEKNMAAVFKFIDSLPPELQDQAYALAGIKLRGSPAKAY